MNKIKKIINASLLCIKYPFLYPRNRFDGKHHTHVLGNYTSRLYRKCTLDVGITGKLIKDDSKKFFSIDTAFDLTVKLSDDKTKAIIKKGSDSREYKISRVIWGDKFEIIGVTIEFALTGRPIIMFHVNTKDKTDSTNYGFTYDSIEFVTNKRIHNWYKFISWIDKNILDRILFIPTYTELDSMPEGWRKAFGIKMCDEIKQELKKHKGALRNYRITDIKEKFGGLRWYDFGSPEKVWKEIIPKYTELSYKTCIDCGKPAEYISVGWISPYCNNCKQKDRDYIPITEQNAFDKAYKYYWQKEETYDRPSSENS